MATQIDPQQDSETSSQGNVHVPSPRRSQRKRSGIGGGLKIVFWLLVLGVIAGGAVYGLPQVVKFSGSPDESGVLTYTVDKNDLLITVTEDGNAESASNIDIKCDVAGGSTILWIVEEGKFVEQDEELVRLDTANIEEQLRTQEIAAEKANATMIQARESFEAAEIAVREYEQGTFVQELTLVESEIRVAEENLTSAKNFLEYTKKMVRKGFATALQRQADEFAVERAELDLKAAETKKRVLVDFTKEKMTKELVAVREAAEATARSDKSAYELEARRRDRLKKQLANCVIKAPQRGMVIYANDQSRRRSGSTEEQVQEGAVVREGQDLIRLPDLSRMQVRVTVHESRVDQIKPEMPARVEIQGHNYQGKVVSVANQPEPGSWFSANVKEYATIVAIESETNGLRPGQTAHVEILIADIKDAVTVPVSCVVSRRNGHFCWVQVGDDYEQRELKLGQTNDKLVEVIDGVKVGDVVLRNPRAVKAEARKEVPADQADRDRSDFGPGGPDRGEVERGPSPGEQGPRSDPGEGRPAGTPPAGGQRPDLMQYDADGDKRVSKDEAPERMRSFFDRIDTDGDGYISAQEISAARSRMPNGQGRPGGGPPGAAGGPGDSPAGRPGGAAP